MGLLPMDQTKYLSCLFGTWAIAPLYKKMPHNSAYRHLFSIVVSFAMMFICFGMWSWVHSFIASTVTYLLLYTMPFGRKSHLAVFAFNMLYLSVCNIYMMAANWMNWSVDFTGIQMLMVVKLVSFAFSYMDGFESSEKVDKHFKDSRVVKLPSILQWYGFVYFYASFLVGPNIQYNDYMKKPPSHTITNSWGTSKKVLAKVGLLLVPIYLTLRHLFPLTFITSDGFAQMCFPFRVLYSYLCLLGIRFKYYIGWSLSESALVACGTGYNGIKEYTLTSGNVGEPHENLRETRVWKIDWGKAKNIKILNIEFATTLKDLMANWNISTAVWLKDCVYLRLLFNGYKGWISVLVTNVVSAIWHGFYPGYLLTFIGGGMTTDLEKEIQKKVPIHRDRLLKVLSGICIALLVAYFAIPFQIYSFRKSLMVWWDLYFYGHLIVVPPLIYFKIYFF